MKVEYFIQAFPNLIFDQIWLDEQKTIILNFKLLILGCQQTRSYNGRITKSFCSCFVQFKTIEISGHRIPWISFVFSKVNIICENN